MPRKSQQKLKIMRLHDILLEHTDEDHGLSLNQIQAMLKDQGITAERKSLYDDINELRDYGIDIELKRGSNPTYHVLSRNFQLPELKLLVDSVQASKFITRKKSLELISKLEKQASVHQARELNREVAVANRTKTDNESIYYAVDCIHDAINNNRQITFQYLEWTPKKEMKPRYNGKVYLVSPYAVTLSEEKYYMIAYDEDKKEVRHYRIDKIHHPQCTEYKRTETEFLKNFDIASYTNKNFEMYKGDEMIVELQCKNHMASVIIDRFGEDVPFTNLTDTTFNAHVKVCASPTFYGWLTNFPTGITVVSPESIKIGYMEHIRAILAGYDKREGYSSDVKI